jgi:hypothetical protein
MPLKDINEPSSKADNLRRRFKRWSRGLEGKRDRGWPITPRDLAMAAYGLKGLALTAFIVGLVGSTIAMRLSENRAVGDLLRVNGFKPFSFVGARTTSAATIQEADASPGPYFRTCAQARAAGYRNIPRGAPGYAPHLDRDGDGIACEPVTIWSR